jgi:hypothetical protein
MNRSQITILIVLLIPVTTTALTSTILSTDPAPLEPGEYAEITVRLESNPGESELTNVELTPIETDLIRPISQPTTYSTIQEGDIVTATFTIYVEDDTPEGTIPFLLELKADQSTQTFDKRVSVTDDLDDPELRIGAVETTPNEIIQDTEDNELSLTVNNLGDQAAKQVTAELQETDDLTESYAYSLRDTASQIDANDQHAFTYTFDVSEHRQDPIDTTLNLEYREDNDDGDRIVDDTLDLTIPVANAPYLTVTDVTTPDLKPGSVDNTVEVTVTNNGSADAEEVRVRLFPDISYPFIFETTTRYVASTLKPGDNATVTYDVEVLSDASPRDYQITTELESLVNTNRYERQDTITVPVSDASAQSYNWVPYAAVAAIILIAVLLGVYQYRRRQHNTQDL